MRQYFQYICKKVPFWKVSCIELVGKYRPTNRPSCQPPKIRPSCSWESAGRQTDRQLLKIFRNNFVAHLQRTV